MAIVPYTGQAFPPPDADEVPLVGVAPIVNLFADADANNVATMFLQQYRSLANHAALMQALADIRPRVFPAVALTGFSAVTQVGAGTGTVEPVCVSSTAANTYRVEKWVVKIVVPGAVGVATFLVSTNGGRDYTHVAETVTAALWVGATVSIAFTGTFEAGDTYQFYPVDAPQAAFKGSHTAGVGALIDHMGLLGGPTSTIEENWDAVFVVNASTADAQIATVPRWRASTTADASIANEDPAANTYESRTLKIIPGLANTNAAVLYTAPLLHGSNSNLALRMEWDFFMSAVGANLVTWEMGLKSADLLDAITFYKQSAANEWRYRLLNGLDNITTTTGVTPLASTRQRFRLEYYAGGSFAPLARWFVNRQLVASVVPQETAAGLGMYFAGTCTAGATSFGRLSPVRLTWVRYASASSFEI